MKKRTKLWATVLSAALLLSLLTASALAAPLKNIDDPATDGGSADHETVESSKAKENGDKDKKSKSQPSPLVFVETEETHYAKPDSVVFNNGGTVYNNGATVYNNSGTVYNNNGTVYNNNGTIYANGGVVYNNGGSVFDNGAEIHSQSGEVRGLEAAGAFKLELNNDLRTYLNIDTVEEGDTIYIKEGESLSFAPKEGYNILSADVSSGELISNKFGEYTLSNLTEDAVLNLQIKPMPPVMSLESGTYFSSQKLSMSAGEGAEIYYTTDGSDPDENSLKYSQPIAVDQSTAIKAVAVSRGLEVSDISSANVGVLEITAPEFEKKAEGYPFIDPLPVVVKNTGTIEAQITGVEIEGDNAENFILAHHSGQKIAAGRTIDDYWTIRPEGGLKAGNYNAKLVLSTENGEKAEFKLTFQVESK